MSKLSGSQVIALTGTMGSGKSTLTRLLSLRMPVTDCDQINRDLMQPKAPGYQALKEAGLLQTDAQGNLDAPAQAAAMFSDPAYKKGVEAILHPLIRQSLLEWISRQNTLCAVEVPLLFESGMDADFEEIWCVTCSLETALDRLQNGRNISRQEAMARISRQMPAQEKCIRSRHILYNDGTIEELQQQADQLLSAM